MVTSFSLQFRFANQILIYRKYVTIARLETLTDSFSKQEINLKLQITANNLRIRVNLEVITMKSYSIPSV